MMAENRQLQRVQNNGEIANNNSNGADANNANDNNAQNNNNRHADENARNNDGPREVVEIREQINKNILAGLLQRVQSLQVSAPMPTFRGENDNPLEFLEKVEKYFKRKGIVDEEQKLIVIEDALIRRAGTWIDTQPIPFRRYNNFREVFLINFNTIEARMKAKDEWQSRKFRIVDGSRQNYFAQQVRAARFVAPTMEAYEVNFTIIKQLPTEYKKFCLLSIMQTQT